jgi:hypothetical protein
MPSLTPSHEQGSKLHPRSIMAALVGMTAPQGVDCRNLNPEPAGRSSLAK